VNADLANTIVPDMLDCLTNNLQAVWPGTQLTVNTANVFNCQPVLPLTVQEFNDIKNSILNNNFLTGTKYQTSITFFTNTIDQQLTGLSTSTQLSTISTLSTNVRAYSYYLLASTSRDFSTTVGTLAGAASSSMTPDLQNMLVTDYLVCLIQAAPWP
jgi:hypothetical protein